MKLKWNSELEFFLSIFIMRIFHGRRLDRALVMGARLAAATFRKEENFRKSIDWDVSIRWIKRQLMSFLLLRSVYRFSFTSTRSKLLFDCFFSWWSGELVKSSPGAPACKPRIAHTRVRIKHSAAETVRTVYKSASAWIISTVECLLIPNEAHQKLWVTWSWHMQDAMIQSSGTHETCTRRTCWDFSSPSKTIPSRSPPPQPSQAFGLRLTGVYIPN